MLCVECGKDSDNVLCQNCQRKRELFKIKDFSLNECIRCGSYYYNGWDKNLQKKIKEAVEKNIETNNTINDIDINFKKAGSRISVSIKAEGYIGNAKKEEKKIFFVNLKSKKCDDCVMKLGGYYEAVVQVRGENKEKIMQRVKDLTVGFEVEQLKEGYNIKLTKKADGKNIINRLKDCDVKRSFKLVGKKNGKDLCRNYYSIK